MTFTEAVKMVSSGGVKKMRRDKEDNYDGWERIMVMRGDKGYDSPLLFVCSRLGRETVESFVSFADVVATNWEVYNDE